MEILQYSKKTVQYFKYRLQHNIINLITEYSSTTAMQYSITEQRNATVYTDINHITPPTHQSQHPHTASEKFSPSQDSDGGGDARGRGTRWQLWRNGWMDEEVKVGGKVWWMQVSLVVGLPDGTSPPVRTLFRYSRPSFLDLFASTQKIRQTRQHRHDD